MSHQWPAFTGFMWEKKRLGVVVHTCNPSIRVAEAGGLQVPDQTGLHGMTLSQTKQKNNKNQTTEAEEQEEEEEEKKVHLHHDFAVL
jgi:hypothetical protein